MKIRTRKKGFGILEVLLAGVIIIIVMSAIVVLGRSAMTKTQYLQQRAEATFLAQEGIELIRQIRDSNYIDGNNATAWDNITLTTKPTLGRDYFIIFNSSRYFMTTTAQTIDVGGVRFTRKINYRRINDSLPSPMLSQPAGTSTQELINNSYIVESTVTWSFLGQSKNVVLRELITNSRQQF